MNRGNGKQTYYEILGVDPTADSKSIRQAYLKQAVKYHPDKNPPEQAEQAKERFVLIGHAYEVLSDPSKRSRYDRELRLGGHDDGETSYASTTTNQSNCDYDDFYTSYQYCSNDDHERTFQSYRAAFDAHVASMSEEEVAAIAGLASIVGGILGSVLGSRLGSSVNGSRSATGGSVLLSSLGAMAGSFLTSQAAAETVRSIHQQSVERVTNQQPEYVQNNSSNTSRQRTDRPSNSNNPNEVNITLEDVVSAVDAGMRLWQSFKATHRK